MRLLQVSDLHLSAMEADYSLGVLAEIVEQSVHADALLVCGHFFEQVDDATAGAARDILAGLSCPAYVIPADGEPIPDSLVPATVLGQRPWGLCSAGDQLEILAIPGQSSYASFPTWAVPRKRAAHRVVMAHAVVIDTPAAFAPRSRGPALDPELLGRFSIDYAALGSVHRAPELARAGDIWIAHSGAARVIERHERQGSGLWIELGAQVSIERIAFAAAGSWQRWDVLVSADGSVPEPRGVDTRDWLEVHLHGALRAPLDGEQLVDALTQRWSHTVRRLDIDASALQSVSSRAAQAWVERFTALWQGHAPAPMEAYDLGLAQLCNNVR